MAFENGVNWRPLEPGARGRHGTFASALEAAYASLSVERSDFFDSLVDNWRGLFPESAARPGRVEGNMVVLYVKSPSALYAMRMRLGAIRRRLSALDGAPRNLSLRLEVHS